MISIELQDVLTVCRQIRGNDRDSGAHYLLGYLWANTSEIAGTNGICVLHIVFSEVILDFLSLGGLLLIQPSIHRSLP